MQRLHDPDSGTTYVPWTGPNGEVGFECRRGDEVGYVYLNPSGGSDDGVPTVFLYQGAAGDARQDAAVVYVEVS